MTPAATTTITLIKVPTPVKTTRVMRATTEMNALNVGVHLEIQKAYKYIDLLNIIVSKTRQHLLDSGLVALIKDVTFVNRENSACLCLVRKTRKKHQIKQAVTCKTENVCYSFFKYVAFCTGFNPLTLNFMLPYIIMDLPIFVITESATLLVDIRCPRGGSQLSIPIHFSGLAALMSADIARNL